MQLSRRANKFGVSEVFHDFLPHIRHLIPAIKPLPQGVIGTAVGIVKNEGFFSLYRGLGAVLGGVVPKMAIRFTSYEYYKRLLTDKDTMKISRNGTFLGETPFTTMIPHSENFIKI